MAVDFKDNTAKVTGLLYDAAIKFLHEAGITLVSRAKRNTRVDTGQLKNSWKYIVDENDLKVIVGSPLENAIWEEFGTGEHALNKDGRKTPWKYQDDKGEWHTTTGKEPKRALHNAFLKAKPKLDKRFQTIINNEVKK